MAKPSKPKTQHIGPYRVEVTTSRSAKYPKIYKIDSPIYRNAKLVSVNGSWTTRISKSGHLHRRTTPFVAEPLNEEAIKRALELLERRYEQIYGINDEPSRYEIDERPTMAEVVHLYSKTLKKSTPASKRHFSNAVQFFFNEDYIADESLLKSNIRKIVANTDAAPETVAKYLSYIKKIAQFAVEEEIFRKNPLEGIKVDRKARKSNSKLLPSKSELNKAISYLSLPYDDVKPLVDQYSKENNIRLHYPQSNYEGWTRFLRILEQTAMRPGELISLKVIDIEKGGFNIRGAKTGDRVFPFIDEYFKTVRVLIEEQLKEADNEYLFPFVTYKVNRGVKEPVLDTPRRIWKAVQLLSGMNKPYRLYDLRAIALNRWEKEYGFRQDIIDDIGGNSQFIREKHYRTSLSVDDIISKAKRGLT